MPTLITSRDANDAIPPLSREESEVASPLSVGSRTIEIDCYSGNRTRRVSLTLNQQGEFSRAAKGFTEVK